MIAPFDIFGRGLYRYTFEETCRECPDLKLEDGALMVFINTKGTNRQDFSKDLSRCILSGDTSKERSVCESLDFMEYIVNTAEKTDSTKIKQIHKRIMAIRKSEKAGVKYMQRWEELEYARDDGKTEGRAEERKESEFNMTGQLISSAETAMWNFIVDSVGACKGLGYKLEEYHKAKELVAARSI